VAYFVYQGKLRRAKAIERGLKMVPVLIHLPPPSADTESGSRDIREVMREKTAQAEVLYNLIAGTATEGFKSKFYGQRHIALELIAADGLVHFYAAVPVALMSTIEKAIQTAYPGARMEEVEDHNIFSQQGRLAATMGGEMVLRTDSAYPVATYASIERDPMEAIITTLSALPKGDGAAIQIMLRPASTNWVKHSTMLSTKLRKGRANMMITPMDVAKAAFKSPVQERAENREYQPESVQLSNLELNTIEAVEDKTKHPGFEVLIRVLVSTENVAKSQQLLRDVATAFALFERPGLNGFKFLPAMDVQGLVTAFIFRFFPPELRSNILNSGELATLFHLPDSQFVPTSSVERQRSKEVDGPVQLPTEGLLFGYNEFRGVKKEIRLSPDDRRRHTYILGQTGTGKSTLLENLAVQDMLAGGGFAFIDPHGDTAEKLLAMVPKNRSEDVIYFNPADTEFPLGLNLFEFSDPAQKDFLIQETIGMLYKLYDPGHTGIIGPRYEHWYRNAALTLMSDPNGSTFIEIPKVFTDTEYLKQKFRHLKDPTVIDFWTKEMGQTSDYHKSEMLGWFVSKFGAFQNNEMMRNIIGQTKSAFNLRDVMDNKKILIVNLSKGRIGELNSQLLGMIFVIKFQAAAMSRADMTEAERSDFSLYVDEFQNFSTDSFASILSEARKYRLNLIVANQFIGQLSNEIRDAVFGNIGTIIAHRMGPEDAEFMVKQFAPVFDASDLLNIPNYHAAMRLMIGGLPSQPFTVHNLAPLGVANPELGLAIKQLSAAKFGLAKEVVEADITRRLTGHGSAAGTTPAAPELEPKAAAPAAAATPEPAASPAVSPASAPAPAPVGAVGPAPEPAPVPAPLPVQPAPAAPVPLAPPTPPAPPASPEPVKPAPTPVPVPAPPAATPTPAPAPSPQLAPPAASAPAPAPKPPAFLPNSAAESLAAVTPPIGAPPVSLSQSGPVLGPVSVASPSGNAAEPLVPPAAPPTAPSMLNSDAPSPLPGLAHMPPPIGAPPVDVGGAAEASSGEIPVVNTAGQAMKPVDPIIPEENEDRVARAIANPGSLNITDITGGRRPAPVPAAPLNDAMMNVPLIPAGAEPMVAAPAAATPPPVLAQPIAPPYDPAQDPMAAVPLLAPPPEPDPEPKAELVSQPAAKAEPKPEPTAGPIVLPQPADLIATAAPAAPSAQPVPPAPSAPMPVATPQAAPAAATSTTPLPAQVPAPSPQPSSTPAPVPAPAAAPAQQSVLPPAPQPLAASAPVLPSAPPAPSAAPMPEPEPRFAASPATTKLEPAPSAAPTPSAPPEIVAEPIVPDSDNVDELMSDSLIHFVDPRLETVLERPLEDVKPPVAASSPSVPAVLPPVPAPAPAPVPTPKPAPPAPTPSSAVAPIAPPAATVPAPPPPPAGMATLPPPIGAPPVDVNQPNQSQTETKNQPALPPAPAPVSNPAPSPAPNLQAAPPLASAPKPSTPKPPLVAAPSATVPTPAPTPAPAKPVSPVSVAPVAPPTKSMMETDREEAAAEDNTPVPVGLEAPGAHYEEQVAAQKQAKVAPAETPAPAQAPAPVSAPPAIAETKAPAAPPKSEAATPAKSASTGGRSTEEALAAVMAAAAKKREQGASAKSAAPVAVKPTKSKPVSTKPAPPQPVKPAAASNAPVKPKLILPQPKVDANDVVAETEHQIDELMGQALIKLDKHGPELKHKPSGRPAETDNKSEDESERHWVGSALPKEPGNEAEESAADPTVTEAPRHETHTLTHAHQKVIQPLEPIVPRREEIQRELEEELKAEEAKGGETAPGAVGKADKSQAQSAPAPKPPTPPQSPAPKPSPVPADSAKPVPSEKPAAPAPAIPVSAPVKPPTPTPPAPAADVTLPPAESLVKSTPGPQPEIAKSSTGDKSQPDSAAQAVPEPAASGVKIFRHGQHSRLPDEAPEGAPQSDAPAASADQPSKKAAEAKPAHRDGANEPTQAQSDAAPLTGKLIMPSADQSSQQPEASAAPSQKPPKLSRGEVYVDERGNVIVGE